MSWAGDTHLGDNSMKMEFKVPRLEEVTKTARKESQPSLERPHRPLFVPPPPTSCVPRWRGKERVVQEEEIMCAETWRLSDAYVVTLGILKRSEFRAIRGVAGNTVAQGRGQMSKGFH